MRFAIIIALLSAAVANAHTILTYPGWRGNNLITNSTFRYGMQWMYPCGGLGMSENRTKWPINGGAVAVQPGWNSGHPTAFFYINMGFGTDPANYSFPIHPVFQVVGPDANPYPGSFCVPQLPLPATWNAKVGDNATIQIIEVAIHGASLYNCVDITFTDASEVEPVTKDNCFNSSNLSFNTVFASSSLTSGVNRVAQNTFAAFLPLVLSAGLALLA